MIISDDSHVESGEISDDRRYMFCGQDDSISKAVTDQYVSKSKPQEECTTGYNTILNTQRSGSTDLYVWGRNQMG